MGDTAKLRSRTADLSRRDNRTQPGVLTPGTDKKKCPALKVAVEQPPKLTLGQKYLTPLQHPQPATRVQLAPGTLVLGAASLWAC